MAPTKAAKKVAKKAAKKAPSKHAGKDPKKAGKDVRRAYEHLGRVQVLAQGLDETQGRSVQVLVQHAEATLRGSGQAKDAADLLRAAEHFGFGSLALHAAADDNLSDLLLNGIREEFDHLRERAVEHGEAAGAIKPVLAIYKGMARSAAVAMKARQYRAALEFARGAEALTHVAADLLTLPLPAAKRPLPNPA